MIITAQWESALGMGGQQYAQIGNYFNIWKNLLSKSPSKHNQFKIPKKCHDVPKFA